MKHVSLLEIEVLEWEVNFHDAGCLHSRSENVLLGRLVILGSKSVQIVQETEKERTNFGHFLLQ